MVGFEIGGDDLFVVIIVVIFLRLQNLGLNIIVMIVVSFEQINCKNIDKIGESGYLSIFYY